MKWHTSDWELESKIVIGVIGAFIDGSLTFESLQFSPLFQFSLLLQWFVLISIDKSKTVQIVIQKHRTALIMFQNYRIYYDLLREVGTLQILTCIYGVRN